MKTSKMSGFLALLFTASVLQGSFGAIKVTPREVVVKEGDPIEMLCHAPSSVEFCKIYLPGTKEGVIVRQASKLKYGLTLIGEGFENGDCGVRIPAAKEIYNGQFTCALALSGYDSEVFGKMNVTIAIPPIKPELQVSPKKGMNAPYQENEFLTATCTVRNGRPVPNITWFIGEEKITDGLGPIVQTNGRPNELIVRQNITRKVQASDNGKELKCIAAHPLFTETNNNTVGTKIAVQYAPKEVSQPFERFGLVEGEEGRISITVMANPKPTFTWLVNGKKLHEGDNDGAGKLSVLPGKASTDMGDGYWDSVLILNSLTNEDVNSKYELVASNVLGEQTYKVAISTSPEPKMLELGAGAIVGIVVAVLLLLTLIAVVLFARAKGRWCFAGASAQFAGECSDTESADHHGTHPKIKKTPFTSVFKKKTDKVSLKEPEAVPNPEEEKRFIVSLSGFRKEEDNNEPARVTLNTRSPDEGVVYAELDLNLAPGARPPPTVRPDEDKTEYAEIIHTKESN